MRTQLSKPMVIRTKLRPPARRGGLVPRPELVARLCDTRKHRLATIQAAAGFGKTSLLSQCYERIRGEQPAAWLSLDASDNDYLRFLAHLFAAIEASGVELGREFKYVARFGSRLAPGTCADLLTSALDYAQCGLTICVDDFHVLDDAPSAQLLSQLLLAPRSSVSWLLASRTALASLPLNRLRLLNELLEIDTHALKFSTSESHAFLCSAVGEPLEPTLSRLLTERTEGWVAGLQLASLGLRAVGNRAELIRGFTGANRNVADFLRDTVLSNLDDGTHDFLLATSILPRLSVELCNFVTGRNDARSRLDLLETLNLFIFSLDDERRWYRYHHLFAEFLEQRLCDRDPVRARQLQERASVWFEESGLSSGGDRACAAGAGLRARGALARCAGAVRQGRGRAAGASCPADSKERAGAIPESRARENLRVGGGLELHTVPVRSQSPQARAPGVAQRAKAGPRAR